MLLLSACLYSLCPSFCHIHAYFCMHSYTDKYMTCTDFYCLFSPVQHVINQKMINSSVSRPPSSVHPIQQPSMPAIPPAQPNAELNLDSLQSDNVNWTELLDLLPSSSLWDQIPGSTSTMDTKPRLGTGVSSTTSHTPLTKVSWSSTAPGTKNSSSMSTSPGLASGYRLVQRAGSLNNLDLAVNMNTVSPSFVNQCGSRGFPGQKSPGFTQQNSGLGSAQKSPGVVNLNQPHVSGVSPLSG